jgi:putative membrane protein
MGALRHIGGIAWCAGIAVFIGLIMWSGLSEIGSTVLSVGWGMLFVVLTRVATVSVAGAGWWMLFPARGRVRLWLAIFLRFVREAVNSLLPLTQVGGDIVGARLLTFWAVPGPRAAASVIIDVLIQAATLFLFAALGLVLLIALGADKTVAWVAATGLGLAIPMLGGFYLAQRGAGRRFLYFVLRRLKFDGSWRVLGTVDAVYQSLSMIYARRSTIAASGQVHMLGWLIGVAEVWIVLACIGHPVSVGDALVIESLTQAVRAGAFVIPSAIGAQEAGLILLCGLFGIPSDQALALSLIKRAADVVVGLPGLVALQILESGRLAANACLNIRARASIDVQTKSL